MGKKLGLALAISLLTTGAFASKARLQALGEDENGSFIVQDVRNIFYSPAQALYYKDGVAFEWGDTSEISDTNSDPRAEGGILKSYGNMVYGLYFGYEASDGNALRQFAGTGTTEMNNVSFLAGIQWGAAITYGSFKNEGNYATLTGQTLGGTPGGDSLILSDGDASLLRSRLSAITGDWEFYARINLLNNAEAGAAGIDQNSDGTIEAQAGKQSFDGKSGWQVGAIHTLNEYKYVLTATGLSGENEAGTEYKYSAYEFQVGSVKQLNDTASMNYRIGAKYQDEEEGNFITSRQTGADPSAFDGTEAQVLQLPAVLGLEVQANEWLILRSSVEHVLWSSYDDGTNDSQLADTTSVNAGAGVVFGDFLVDVSLQNTNQNNKGRASMTYKF